MKKFMIVAVVVFAFALTMSVAFACNPSPGCVEPCQPVCPCPDQSNDANNVHNTISSEAYSGGNYVSKAGVGGAVYISSGSARSSAYGVNAINTNAKLGSALGAQVNDAKDSGNLVDSFAGTGENGISKAHVGGSATIYSGSTSSRAKGINLVNTNVKVGGGCHRSSCLR